MTDTRKLDSFATPLAGPAQLGRRFQVLALLDSAFGSPGRYSYSRSFLGEPQRIATLDTGDGDQVFVFFRSPRRQSSRSCSSSR